MQIEYKKLVKYILTYGQEQQGRNGDTLIIPNYSFIVDHSKKDNHVLRLRKMYTAGIRGEFQTLVDPTPLTNVKQFEANGCNYWKLWAKEDGSINVDYHNQLHPQLEDVITNIKKDPTSRRHVISLWDHKNLDNLSLPCCWNQLTFSVINNTLHLNWVQRSTDVMIGLPSDIYLSYLFMEYVAKETSLSIGTCMYSLSNVHIYKEHIEGAKELINRTIYDFDKPIKFELKQ